MSNALQTFLRMANLYNPQTMSGGMPDVLPVQPQLINRASPGISVPGAYEDTSPTMFGGQTFGNDLNSTLEAFRQSVLNPPQRTHMTYPKNTLAGLDAALKIAAEPSPTEKNRVYVNGKPYQKQQVYTDPETGEKKYITNVKDPSFMSQVLRAMPAAISPAVDILNQPYEDAVADWELKNKGLGAAAKAESDMALAGQRQANTAAIPQKIAQGDRALDIRLMDAQTRQRLAALKDLPDSEKIRLFLENKISLEELKASNQYSLQELRGQQRSSQIAQQGNITSGHIAQRGAITSGQIAQRGEEARKTKEIAPGGGGTTASIPTQQKVALQAKTQQIINQHPEWADYISINQDGFPEIEPPSWYGGPDKPTYDQIYEAIYGSQRAAPINQPSTSISPTVKTPTTKPVAKPTTKPAQSTGGMVEMVTPDGSGTRMVPANMVQQALAQGYKPKGGG